MKNGQTLWNNLKAKYNEGVDSVESYIKLWKSIDRTSLNADDQTKMRQVDQLLQIQLENARLWRDTCIDYFRKFAHQK
jgi:alpha-glucuronidase